MHRRIAILAVVASTLLLMGLSAGQAVAAGDDDIPGVPTGAGVISGVVDEATDEWDVYAVKLFDGEEVRLTTAQLTGRAYYHVRLLSPDSKSVHGAYTTLTSLSPSRYNPVMKAYTPAKDGVYYIAISANDPGATYSITISGSAEVPPSASYLRLRASATKATKGGSVTLSAKLVNVDSALIAGYSVSLFRSYNGRSWTKVKALSSATGDYSTRERIVRKTWFRMRFAGDATWSGCSSRAVAISVR